MKLFCCQIGIVLILGSVLQGSVIDTTDKKIPELGVMVVTATRSQTLLENTPDITVVVTQNEIAAMNPRDVSDILDYLPGVSTEGGTGGGSPFKKTVTINGMPVLYSIVMVDGVRVLSSHIHTGANVNVVAPEAIDRIELIKGAASAQYGSDAMGGILNIITKKGTQQSRMNFTTSRGSQQTYHGGLSVTAPINKKVTHSLYSGWDQTDGLPIIEPASRKGAFGYKKLQLMDRVDVMFTEKLAGHASVQYTASEAPFGGESMNAYAFTPKADIHISPAEGLRVTATTYYTIWENEKNSERNELAAPEVVVGYIGLPKHSLLTGGEFNYRNFDRKRVEEHAQRAGAVFIQDEFKPVTMLTLLGALRYDMVELPDNEKANVVSPKLSVLVKPVPVLRLRVSVGRGFRAPTVQDLYETLYGHADDLHFRAGNRDLKPEYSTNLTGGVELVPFKRLSVMVNGYYNIINDMITPVDQGLQDPDELFPGISADLGLVNNQVYVYQRQNIHKAKVMGGEVRARFLIYKGYSVDGGFSLVHNENTETNEILPYYPGKSVFFKINAAQPITPMVELTGFAGIKATRDRAIWKYKHSGAQKVDLEDYQKLDAGLGIKFVRKYEFYFMARNLLEQELHMYEDKELRTEGKMLFEGGLKVAVF
jgi:outer membrane cobalamin receptor